MLGRGSMLAALAVMPAGLSAIAGAKTVAPSARLTKDTFASLLGSSFQVTSHSTRQWLTLVSVEDLPPNPPVTGFSLRFYGGSKELVQGTYTLHNETTGKFSLFIVPAGDGQLFYTAIVTRI